MQLLYQAEIWGGPALPLEDVNSCLESWERDSSPDDEMRTFVIEAVHGVSERVGELDAKIAEYAQDWTIDRMPVIDKNILRLALRELLYCSDIPWQVSINEAVELAKRYSTPECASFVNGVLSAVQLGRGPGQSDQERDD